jgi:hypothetical protein
VNTTDALLKGILATVGRAGPRRAAGPTLYQRREECDRRREQQVGSPTLHRSELW